MCLFINKNKNNRPIILNVCWIPAHELPWNRPGIARQQIWSRYLAVERNIIQLTIVSVSIVCVFALTDNQTKTEKLQNHGGLRGWRKLKIYLFQTVFAQHNLGKKWQPVVAHTHTRIHTQRTVMQPVSPLDIVDSCMCRKLHVWMCGL